MTYFQTGDVLYKQIESLPSDANQVEGNLIHKGENHHHTIAGDFALHSKGDDLFIEAKSDCELLHPEHKTIVLPVGIYQKGIVQEYSHFDEESRNVID